MQQQLAQRFTGAELRAADGAGHFIQVDRPDAVIAAIDDVLRAGRR
jgi:pimeloyl-ACP methyl ester carboxylesterase